LGDIAGVLFAWSIVEFIKSFTAMDQSARRGFSKNAAYLTFPFVMAFSLLLPVFEWAALALMFIPIVFLGAAVSRQNDLITHIKKNSQRVITTQETERNRIARDLHDHIGQVLTALTLRVAILRKQAPEELEKDLDLLDQLVATVFHDVHEIVEELSPRDISSIGLSRSLQDSKLHKMLATANISYTTYIDAEIAEIPDQLQIAVFRISQEALSNIARHSSATECSLKLRVLDKQGSTAVRLEIRDNGAGFDSNDYVSGHGLKNITDRAQVFWGTLSSLRVNGELFWTLPCQPRLQT